MIYDVRFTGSVKVTGKYVINLKSLIEIRKQNNIYRNKSNSTVADLY
jgi:hypothetical protein